MSKHTLEMFRYIWYFLRVAQNLELTETGPDWFYISLQIKFDLHSFIEMYHFEKLWDISHYELVYDWFLCFQIYLN